jgi:hypothetical protein
MLLLPYIEQKDVEGMTVVPSLAELL